MINSNDKYGIKNTIQLLDIIKYETQLKYENLKYES